ncbi:hypothetical protein [Candidatus Berkiella aquae]|uniref:Uncharacterized protein n=1 Tax=Candidatus Berkiella aquae TaxID=295108 RepID=A0A0Q9Z069_9GAMM|nr:hypothetical protein [Candidatus Berkiella aquae]MCS5712376.1 hypothetical protein [Candidatus Berkiella aquae]
MVSRYTLEGIIGLAQDVKIKDHRFGQKRAIEVVIRIFKLTANQARNFIIREVSKLEHHNFARSTHYGGMTFDIYGKRINNIPFYIKFSIIDDSIGQFIYVISFHPTEDVLTTQSETLEAYKGEGL